MRWYLNDEIHSLTRAAAGILPDEAVLRGDAQALETFHFAARTVRAYQDFLAGHGIRAEMVRTIDDLRQVPYTAKENYLDLYPIKDLVPGGDLTRADLFNTSSGTTGRSYLWPCSTSELIEGALLYELVFERSFSFSRRSTLLVICFGMGTWIAGLFTTFASFVLKQRKYPLTLVTPGFNKEETLQIIRSLGSLYDQIIIAGIPTFIKDLFETIHQDPKLTSLSFRCLFAGEGFSEEWRSYVLRLMNQPDAAACTASVYGSADASLKAFETSETISLRRHLGGEPRLCQSLFGQERVPSLFHFVPWMRHFDTHHGKILVTAKRGIPLVRYNLHDKGGVLELGQWQRHCGDLPEKAHPALPFPLVYLFGRDNFTASLYGVNIFGDNVRDALLAKELRGRITGKFSIETCYDEQQNQYLQFRVELAAGESAGDLAAVVRDRFCEYLSRVSSEYRRMSQEKGEHAKPRVSLHSFADPDFFPEGRIQKSS
jgi:phenylacetate-CoA ligase